MKTIKLLNFLFNVIVALFIGVAVSQFYPVEPVGAAIASFIGISVVRIVSIVMMKRSEQYTIGSMALMAVQTEVWENFIAENLFKDYQWVKRAKDRTSFVINNKVVHIPQAGAKPAATKNRSNFPIPVVLRNDDDVTYAIDTISTESTHIPEADKVELSYDKIASVFGDHVGVMSEESARDILNRWYPTEVEANLILSTGGSTAAYLSTQTGNRKAFVDADIVNAKKRMILMTKRETGNWAWIMTEGAYLQLKAISAYGNKDTMDQYGAVWKDGELVRLRGADIIRTDVTSLYDNSTVPVLKEYASAAAADDNDAILLVDFNYVHFALGDVKFFEGKDDVHYQGDIYNAYVRLGGRKERSDETGVVAIVQDAA